MNLRELAESDLETSLEDSENGFGLPVTITKKSTSETQDLTGQVLYEYKKFSEELGGEVIVPFPIVTLRISTLTIVPADGETWYFDVPETPAVEADKKRYVFDASCVRSGSPSIGFFQYPLREYEDNRT